MNQQDKANLLYFYDLPDTTSVKLAEIMKQKSNYDLQNPAQFMKDITKPFTNAIVRINDSEKLDQVARDLRYFEIDGKPCRALKFDRDLLGANRQKLIENSVFVRGLPTELKADKLHEEFSKFGEIKSLKISLNPDHTSRKYGFICFVEPEAAQRALKEGPYEVIRYAPKDKREFRKVFNNIYVKNFPESWSDEELKAKFSKFGNITSLKALPNPADPKTKFAFICYGSPTDPSDKEYGIKAALEAVKQLNGEKLDENHTLYVKEALKKEEREIEKRKEMIRYKNSKKRCNLYVKNFPPTTTAEELKQLFSQYGTIENIKLFPQEGNALYAFVCFEKPEEAYQAKTTLHNQPFNGKQLYINHYEIKELRKIQNEDIRDKTDFQNYKKQSSGYTMDLLNKPEVFALLNHLLSLVQPKLQSMYNPRGNFKRGGQRLPGQGQVPGQGRPFAPSGHPGAQPQRPMGAPMGGPIVG